VDRPGCDVLRTPVAGPSEENHACSYRAADHDGGVAVEHWLAMGHDGVSTPDGPASPSGPDASTAPTTMHGVELAPGVCRALRDAGLLPGEVGAGEWCPRW
jgi:hypothetical protein